MDETEVSRIDIILIFQAYNRGEFDTDELIRRIREWTDAMLQRQAKEDLCTTPDH